MTRYICGGGGVELIDATVLGQVDSFIGDYKFYCGGGG